MPTTNNCKQIIVFNPDYGILTNVTILQRDLTSYKILGHDGQTLTLFLNDIEFCEGNTRVKIKSDAINMFENYASFFQANDSLLMDYQQNLIWPG